LTRVFGPCFFPCFEQEVGPSAAGRPLGPQNLQPAALLATASGLSFPYDRRDRSPNMLGGRFPGARRIMPRLARRGRCGWRNGNSCAEGPRAGAGARDPLLNPAGRVLQWIRARAFASSPMAKSHGGSAAALPSYSTSILYVAPLNHATGGLLGQWRRDEGVTRDACARLGFAALGEGFLRDTVKRLAADVPAAAPRNSPDSS